MVIQALCVSLTLVVWISVANSQKVLSHSEMLCPYVIKYFP